VYCIFCNFIIISRGNEEVSKTNKKIRRGQQETKKRKIEPVVERPVKKRKPFERAENEAADIIEDLDDF